IGRKATLVAALLTMGLSTVLIGLLPTHAQIGLWAPALLALCRFGQGLGLGGEWGGAVLLATENAPPGKRAWYGMFPQLGAPLGFLLSAGIFLVLGRCLSQNDFLQWGWRIPFVIGAIAAVVALLLRRTLHETQSAEARENKEAGSIAGLFKHHTPAFLTVLGYTAGGSLIFYTFT
ncbi:MFS transporter, partial [Staphylococcus aureus]|nr:MFS transporter [Staphylococcus aureus]